MTARHNVASVSDDDLFDRPARWRAEAVADLGLHGEERIAGLVTGAGYPDALVPIVDSFAGSSGPLCDVGSGLGAAAAWVGQRSSATILAAEPEVHTADLARANFPRLSVVTATAARLPLAAGSCSAVSLLGVVSLVDDLDALIAEATRVLHGGGRVAIADLVAAADETVTVPEAGNVFRPVDVLERTLIAAGCAIDEVWTESAQLTTAWDATTERVDREIERCHAGSAAYAAWSEDRQRLGELIAGGTVRLATIVAKLTTSRGPRCSPGGAARRRPRP